MNKSYISVWNDVSGTWVAAPETARTHCGSGTASSETISFRGQIASRPATPLKAAFMPIAMAIGAIGMAMLPGTAAAQATTGNGGLELCPAGVGGTGSSWGPLSSAVGILDCSNYGGGESVSGMSFSLNNAAADNGAWGYASNSITARVTGFQDGHLELKGTTGIDMLNTVSMTNNKITDLASGDVSSASSDAVNGEQLYQYTRYFQANSASNDPSTDALASGTNSVASGPLSKALGGNSSAYGANAIALATNSVALGAGSQATRADTVSVGYLSADGLTQYTRQITNVSAGAAGTDAVNLDQLNAAIASVNGGGGVAVDNPVTYTNSASDNIILKGASGTKITNLAAGDISSALSMDAVNGSQLFQTNQNVATVANNLDGVSGNLANVTNVVSNIVNNGLAGSPLVVTYDSSAQDQLTLGGVGRSTTVKLTNVEAGDISSASSTDAVNGGQLYQTNQNLLDLADNVGQLGTAIYNGGVKYFHANSALADSSADGTDSVAIGGAAVASANNAVALGSNSVADRANTVSVGAAGTERQIINVATGTEDTDAVNLGQMNAAIANLGAGPGSPNAVVYDSSVHDMLTLGGSTTAPQVLVTNLAAGNVAMGSKDAVNGDQLYKSASGLAAALGAGTSVNPDGTINPPSYQISGLTFSDIGSAMSALNTAAGDLVSAAKYVKVVSAAPAALASGTESVAIGGSAYASGNSSLAIGSASTAAFDNSTAIGVNAQTDAEYTVSVGNRSQQMRITNVANGINPTDAATMAQLNALQSELTNAGTSGVKSMMQTGSSVLSYIAVSSSTTPGAVTSTSEDMNAMAIGPGAAATGVSALTVGAGSAAGSAFSTAVGSKAGALSANATAIGASATVGAGSDNSVSIGYNTRVNSTNALALGAFAFTAGAGSVALGYNALVQDTGTNGLALGYNSTVSAANGVAIGYGAIADRANAVSVGNSTQQSQIINVAAGTSSTDAVNISQLSGVAAAIGGGAAVNADGTIKKPTFTIGGQTYADVGSALAASAANSVQYDTSAHTKLTLGGPGASVPVTLSNVANGVGDGDAVNMGQLKQLGMNVDASGNVTNSFVAYDDTTSGAITLRGANGTTIANVAAATKGDEAVNLQQLTNAGLSVDSSGNVTNSFVAYDDSTSGAITLKGANGTTIANVAAATKGDEAVNLQQLTNAGLSVDSSGNVTNSFVAYDDSTSGAITLKGANGTTIANVAAATKGDEAVNLQQLTNAGLSVDSSGNVTNSFVAYDDSTSGAITLKGANGTTIANVAAATKGDEAVNLQQLKNAGLNVDSSGNVTNSFVAYDDSTKNTITLGGVGSTVPVLLTNVANGQLTATSSDAVTGGQLYNVAQSTANALGGGSSVQANGALSQPSYSIAGLTYGDVGAALSAVDGQIGQMNTTFSTNMKYIKVVSADPAAQASGTNAIAIGGNSYASGNSTLAIGAGSTATFDNSTAIGVNAQTDAENTVSVGNRSQQMRITNVANGINPTDAATMAQLTALQSEVANAATSGVKSMMQSGSAVLSYIAVSSSTTPGGVTTASDDMNAMAIGPVAAATGVSALAVGAGSAAGSAFSTAVGSKAGALSANATAIGASATVGAGSDNSVSIGYNTRVNSTNALALGANAFTSGTGSVALGYNSLVQTAGTNGLALGSYSTVSAANGVAIGYGAIADRANAVSVGNSTQQNQIINVAAGSSATDAVNLGQMTTAINAAVASGSTDGVIYDSSSHDALTLGGSATAPAVKLMNVAAGTLSSSSRDAINGSQLYNTASSVAAALGGGATVNADGTVSATYTLNGQTYSDVGAALVAAASGNDGVSPDAVTYDTSAHTKLTLGGTGASVPAVTLSNVANGVANNDAVNVSQLKALGANLDSSGNVAGAFVAYDDTSKSRVTFGGTTSTVPVVLANVGIGAVTSSSKEAINGSQLYGAMSSAAAALGGGSAVNSSGQISKPVYTIDGDSYTGVDQIVNALNAKIDTGSTNGVSYDTSAHDRLTLGGTSSTTPVTIANVAAATADDEAVNLKQLKDAGLSIDSSGNVTNAFVAYDDASKTRLTLGGVGSTTPVTISNVAAATKGDEAVNLQQLVDAGLFNMDSSGNVTNSFVSYDNPDRLTLTFNPNGAATQLKNVAPGTDGTDAVNLDQMQAYVNANLGGGGGGTANAVAYDDSSKTQVTLGGAGDTTPVKLTNVAGGTDATDAVNFGQFSSLQSQVNNLLDGTGGSTYFNVGAPSAGDPGTAAVASGSDAIAIGNGASATGKEAIAIGKNAVTAGDTSVALGSGAAAPNTNAVALGAGSTTDRDNSVSVGSADLQRQITNVAPGTQGTDAVNMNQLNSAMGNMSNSINNVDRNAAKGIASASALNIVTPYLPGRTTLNAGVANYRGYQAVGLGVSRWNEKGTINHNLGVSTSGGNSTIVRAGIGIVLGN